MKGWLAVAALLAAVGAAAAEHAEDAEALVDAGMAVVRECTGERKSLRCYWYEAKFRRLAKGCFAEDGCKDAFDTTFAKLREEKPGAAMMLGVVFLDVLPELIEDETLRRTMDG